MTQMVDIMITVGRTGKLTPTAMLKPVFVGGVTISRATLHNADWIERMGLRIGDWVKVERGGDVIPKVAEIVEDAEHPRGTENVRFPDAVPGCAEAVVREEGEADYRCVNAGLPCPAARRVGALGQPRGDEHRRAGRGGGGAAAGGRRGEERGRSLLADRREAGSLRAWSAIGAKKIARRPLEFARD